MSVEIGFTANTAQELYKQIADFLEAAAPSSDGGPMPQDQVEAVELETATREANTAIAAVTPTPAVKRALEEAGIPESEWGNIPRSGKNGRMTQGDVKKYAASRPVTTPTPAVKQGESAPAQNSQETPTIDDCRSALKEVNDKRGMNHCLGLLRRFGCARVGELKKEQHAEFVERAKKVAAGELDEA